MFKSRTMDLTEGPIMKKLIAFSVPVLLTSLMNHTFTIADRIVVGKFAENGTQALAAAMFAAGLGAGDEIICTTKTYWASIVQAMTFGAVPVFCNIDNNLKGYLNHYAHNKK